MSPFNNQPNKAGSPLKPALGKIRPLGPTPADVGVIAIDQQGDCVVLERTNRPGAGGWIGAAHADKLVTDLRNHGLTPREVIVTRLSASAPMQDRSDLERALGQLESGVARVMAVRDLDSVARSSVVLAQAAQRIATAGAELFVLAWGRKVDFVRDAAALYVLPSVSAAQRQQILTRTTKGMHAAAARGVVPGRPPFGVRRDENTRQLSVDPTLWPHVHRIFERFVALAGQGPTPLPTLERELMSGSPKRALAGLSLSQRSIARILRNPIYVTGRRVVQIRGVDVECPPIAIADPIDPDLFAQANGILAAGRRRPVTRMKRTQPAAPIKPARARRLQSWIGRGRMAPE